MIKKPNIVLSRVFTNLPPWEMRIINLLYFSNLGLLLIALVLFILDTANYFNSNFYPLEVSVIGISLLSLYFLHKGLKKVAANMINFIPVPIYFLLVSPEAISRLILIFFIYCCSPLAYCICLFSETH